MGMSFRHRQTRTGLSLLEVMVVVSIMALLFSLLLPSLIKARAAARRLTCASHLRGFGNALTLYKTATGKYPPLYRWQDPIVRPPDTAASIGYTAELLVRHSLGKPDAMYCPVSLSDDMYAKKPIIVVRDGATYTYIQYWRLGHISYIYLSQTVSTYPDANGNPTFDPVLESPDSPRSVRAVLAGDRTLSVAPRNVTGSNHKREGGWFYFVSGDVVWRDWNTLTAHPGTKYVWHWPRTSRPRPAAAP